MTRSFITRSQPTARRFFLPLVLVSACSDEPGSPGGAGGGASGVAGVGGGASGAAGVSGGGQGGSSGAPCATVAPPHRLAVSTQTGCALDASGRTHCWGTSLGVGSELDVPFAPMVDVSLQVEHSALVEAVDGYLIFNGEPFATGLIPVTAGLARAVIGSGIVCGIEPCGRATCWGDGAAQVSAVLRDIDFGFAYGCEIDAAGAIICRADGAEKFGEATPPTGPFVALSVGYLHACAIREDGTLACWGRGGPGEPTDGSDEHGWMWGQAVPPAGRFSAVSAGHLHTCAIRAEDRTLVCWGAGKSVGPCSGTTVDECGMALPPPGEFVEVAAAYTHTCALTADAKVRCWGSDTGGRSTPPAALQ